MSARSSWAKLLPAWPKAPLAERCHDAITLLVVHGLMTDAEKDRARDRLMKALRNRSQLPSAIPQRLP